jgi:hypothetical protein
MRAGAPRARSSGSFARSSSLRRALAPGGGLCLRASTPSCCARFIHWLTAPLLTPKARAMSCCFQPSCLSSHARSRRPSRQSVASWGRASPLLGVHGMRHVVEGVQDRLPVLYLQAVREVHRHRARAVEEGRVAHELQARGYVAQVVEVARVAVVDGDPVRPVAVLRRRIPARAREPRGCRATGRATARNEAPSRALARVVRVADLLVQVPAAQVYRVLAVYGVDLAAVRLDALVCLGGT